jgi:hypothetical protein
LLPQFSAAEWRHIISSKLSKWGMRVLIISKFWMWLWKKKGWGRKVKKLKFGEECVHHVTA